jgi:hypothetical protein
MRRRCLDGVNRIGDKKPPGFLRAAIELFGKVADTQWLFFLRNFGFALFLNRRLRRREARDGHTEWAA